MKTLSHFAAKVQFQASEAQAGSCLNEGLRTQQWVKREKLESQASLFLPIPFSLLEVHSTLSQL